MENNMVDNLFDNKHGMTYDQSLNLFEKQFKIFFKNSYSLIKATDYGMSFKIEYLLYDYVFTFYTEKGYIEEYSIKKDDISFNLIDYQPLLKNIKATNEKNICFLINVLKQFLDKSIVN